MPRNDPAVLKEVTVSLPFGIGSASWEADPTERRAAWELYIELVTRVATQPIHHDEGLLRESFNSLYTLFGSTRDILKKAGPDVGISHKSVGGIAILVLNKGLRPFLSKWHPKLLEWEGKRAVDTSLKEHEIEWDSVQECWHELDDLRSNLEIYAKTLAEIAGVDS
jgi:hypothetical protein